MFRMHFRAILVLIGLFAAGASASYSQAHFGLRAAPTVGYLGGDYIAESGGGEWGIEMKLQADVRLFANVEFVAGAAVLHQKGGRKVKTVDSDSLWGYKFGYMHFPFMLRPMFRLGDGPWHIGPFAGVYFGTGGGSCKIKNARYTGFKTDCSDSTVGGEGSDVDYGIPVGIDVIAEFEGGSRWEFTARLDYGLANVLKGAEDQGLKAAHRLIVVGFGFSYPLY